jgi:hypothetical protein
MPSLLTTDVAANYGRMTAQDSYSTGPAFSNFGTRSLRLLKVVTTGGTNNLTLGSDGATGAYTDANSVFSRCVRAIQTMAEVYVVGVPDATSFLILVTGDTVNDASVGSNVANTTYNALEAVIGASMNTGGSATVTATGTAANPGIFVGAALGTFA